MRLKPKVYDILMDVKKGLLNNEIIRVVTGDYGMNRFNLKLLEDRLAPYNLQNAIVRIMVVTPSGSKQQQDLIVENAIGGSANITLKQSLFGESGGYLAEFQIFDETTQVLRLTTPRFEYYAVESLQDEETILASDEYSILQQLMADVGDINNNINTKIETHNTDEISHEDMRTQISEVKAQFNEIATDITDHKKEVVSQQFGLVRNSSLDGVQIMELPFLPKSITLMSNANGTNRTSSGIYAANGQRVMYVQEDTGKSYSMNGSIIRYSMDANNYTVGVLQNITNTGFEILWQKTGNPVGTINIYGLASTHGGV